QVGHICILDSKEILVSSNIWYFDQVEEFATFKKLTDAIDGSLSNGIKLQLSSASVQEAAMDIQY
ncbi:MAG: hypothetical protein NUV86_05130, partial [Candidatus Scalindua sp.]|nr:hypothetical protein [Candidatus Scalindua sp.]MCR4343571.1 hypothetical protein [Candidatus Scalindua sp.]